MQIRERVITLLVDCSDECCLRLYLLKCSEIQSESGQIHGDYISYGDAGP
jgi:hypothetical protein